ncbi:restriction endonuclease subunit S [Rhizobium miluonense]|uniref:Type I restriction enzyme, S subunit n=1 Tax=Rhizobium miluonense TaxID=411945 RepID=A0A1C3X2E0_9HYPH|nr:restriction endonuclease subunit S [Rhizobium miluonense]SCB46432.1 type I restriction enzyme, S subunit [Rhizobium miluonense]
MSLPSGWVNTVLGEIADFIMGHAPPGRACNHIGEGTPFVKAGEFGPQRPIIREWTTQPMKFAAAEDVLICVVGATAGKLNLGADCAIGRSVAAIRPSKATRTEFLFARLQSEISTLRKASTGTAQGVISKDMLASVPIDLPPIAEQCRIVGKLDALTARIARARTELDRVPGLTQKIRERTVEELISSRAKSWKKVSLETLLSAGPTNGWSPKSGSDASGTLTLKLTATTSGYLRTDAAAVKRIYEIVPGNSNLWLEPGDLLIQRANALEHVGAAAIYTGPGKTFIYPDLMMRVRIPDQHITKLVWYQLRSPAVRQYFRDHATGTAGNMPKISGSTVRNVPIWLPLDDQVKDVVTHMDRNFARADRLEAEADRARKLLDRLESAILAKAFRGELVPRDPDDEPAEKLLMRIREERVVALKPKRGRRATF